MPARQQTRPHGKRRVKPGSHWARTAKEIGAAAALAALPILANSLAQSLAKPGVKATRKKPGTPRNPRRP